MNKIKHDFSGERNREGEREREKTRREGEHRSGRTAFQDLIKDLFLYFACY